MLNKLSINFNKTEFMVVTTKQNKPKLKVSIDNNPIKQSNHIKYLGVLIDDNLNWKQQIKEQCSKVLGSKGILGPKSIKTLYR